MEHARIRRSSGLVVLAVVLLAALGLSAAPGSATPPHDGVFDRRPATGDVPSERSTPAVGAVGTDVYLFGGVKDDFRTNLYEFYDDLYRYDTGTDVWTELDPAGPVPPARAFAASLGDNGTGRLYVFGGAWYGPLFVGFEAFGDLWSYSPADNAWTLLSAEGEGPSGRSRPNMWIVGETLYVFGGIDATFETLNDLWAFDLDTGEWTEVVPNGAEGSPPTRHEAHAGETAHNGRLTVYGGEIVEFLEGEFFSLLPDTWEYDLASGTWTDVTPPEEHDLVPERNYGADGIIGNGLYVYGGDIPGGSSGCGAPFDQNVTDDLWRFDLDDRVWVELDPHGRTVPLKRTNAAVVDSALYIFSGFDFRCEHELDEGQIWNRDVYRYRPAATAPGQSTAG